MNTEAESADVFYLIPWSLHLFIHVLFPQAPEMDEW